MVDSWKFIVILNLHLVLGNNRHDLIDGPLNTVVNVGQRMDIKCHAAVNSTIREWSLKRPSTSEEIIFTNWKDKKMIINPHFGIVKVADGVLYTNSTELNDAGIYTCAVQTGRSQPNQYNAHLIVFETEPLCKTNLTTTENNIFEEGTPVWMGCTVNFTGGWAPTMEWRLHEGNGERDEEPTDLTYLANTEIVPNANISSTLLIALYATSNSSYYSCKIYFNSDRKSLMVTANNTPDYNYTWKSPIVNVLPSTQWQEMTTDDSTKNVNGIDPKTISVIVLSILFGATISTVVVIAICTKRRKRSGELPTETFHVQSPDENDTAGCDYYDTIEDVAINNDVMIAYCSPAEDSFPTEDYCPLTPIKSEVTLIYAGIDTTEQPVDKETAITGDNLKDTKYLSIFG